LQTIAVVFTRERSYCFQGVLAIAILSVYPSVCHAGGLVKNPCELGSPSFHHQLPEDSSFSSRKAFP